MVEVAKATQAEMVPVAEKDIPAPDMFRIFKCRRAHMQYIFRDGAIAVFKPRTNEAAGHYLTDDPKKIAELEEIMQGHPHIYKDPEDFEVPKHLADPSVAARVKIEDDTKKQLVEALSNPELLKAAGIDPEAMKKLLTQNQDFGTYQQNQGILQGIANSDTVGAAASESNGVAQGTPVNSAPSLTIKRVN